MLHLKNFWYVIAESDELTAKAPLSRQLFNQHLVLYRGSDGKPIILPDRCMHRCGKLSKGKVLNGQLQCPYHGWIYGDQGKVAAIPTEGNHTARNLCHHLFASIEQEGYIYVCLEPHPEIGTPYSLPFYQKKGWKNIRLQHHFNNNVTNCVENFIDVPHTAFVHDGIFRSVQGRPIRTLIERKSGTVTIDYLDESSNLGSMSWFLNPTKGKVVHIDHFTMPNITHVVYRLPSGWEYLITSQSIPLSDNQTLVYTDISYHFGIWTHLTAWIVKRQAKKVIAQDQEVLADQQEVIEKMGGSFLNMPCDLIHVMISEIREALEQGIDPRTLLNKRKEITFYV
jgi:phenylpropionate dioxygenase-like ring-hydroxylating dioxygenase large terminal subunit